MILYVNGCSHTAAAEAVVPECFAVDDGHNGIDRRPHPANLAASWCSHVAHAIDAELVCDAEAGGSNPRIIRTTRQWIKQHHNQLDQALLIIQWTTWEREEWWHNGAWYQVNASGIDWVPAELQEQYKQFVASVDWYQNTLQAHQSIWEFHQELAAQNINHVFFSGHSTFSDVAQKQHWGPHYMDPYTRAGSYHNWLIENGGGYANPKSYHFDAKSHRLWADHVLQYLKQNNFLK